MTETVLVIGGTGQLGAPVARQLRRDGYRVRLLARTLPAARDRDADLDYVQGALDDTKSLRSALAGCAAVHLSVRGGPTTESYDRVEHRGPAQVAALAALAGVGRLSYLSHMLAAPDAAAPALCAKFRAEQAIAALHDLPADLLHGDPPPPGPRHPGGRPRPTTPPVPHDRGGRLRPHGVARPGRA